MFSNVFKIRVPQDNVNTFPNPGIISELGSVVVACSVTLDNTNFPLSNRFLIFCMYLPDHCQRLQRQDTG